MSKIILMFPGQGSQFKGMGADLFRDYPKEVEQASSILGYDIQDLCLFDPEQKLNLTRYTQPAIYFVSCLYYIKNYLEKNISPSFLCGHSLGEYSAIFAAEVYDLFTGLKIVKKRAELMSEVKNGSMMAVLGIDALKSQDILNKLGIEDIDIANYNSPEQIVLSGTIEQIQNAKNFLEKENYKCIELNVSGAFHSKQMEKIMPNFMRFLVDIPFNNPKVEVICTSTASPLENEYILENLSFQLIRPVKWIQTILYLVDQKPDTFIESEPGKVLTTLTDKIVSSNQR